MKRPKNIRPVLVTAILTIALGAAVALLAVGCGQSPEETYLRLHIRANGNSPEEQSLKLEVRDAVVAYLSPLAEGVATKAEMQALLRDRLDEVEQVADAVLARADASYRAHAYLSRERFPTRTYADLTLPEGVYDAVVVALGEGTGDNWWCVAFPPLCFVAAETTDSDEVVFRSAIAEWFRKNCK